MLGILRRSYQLSSLRSLRVHVIQKYMKLIDEYLKEFEDPKGEHNNAYHSLMDYHGDPNATKYLIQKYLESNNEGFKDEVIQVLRDLHDPVSFDFFRDLLYSSNWRVSLDALVWIGSEKAKEALKNIDYDKSQAEKNWVTEAIEQIEERITLKLSSPRSRSDH